MTNSEKYKQAFSALHASNYINLEENTMKKSNLHFKMRPALAVCLGVVLVFGCMGAAYAADVGGIQETIEIWINGSLADAEVVENGDGSYSYIVDYDEDDGYSTVITAGGVAIDDDGTEHALSPAEVAESFSNEISYDESEEAIYLYYNDKTIDITEYIEQGIRKFALDDNGEMVYFDVNEDANEGTGSFGFSRSSDPTGPAEDYTLIK